MGLLGDAAGAALGALLGGGGGSGGVTRDELVNPMLYLKFVGETVDGVFKEANRFFESSLAEAQKARVDIRHVGNDIKVITEHTYNVVIPHSMQWLEGDIVRKFISPINARLRTDEKAILTLQKWQADIISWRNKIVDPTVVAWRAFDHYYNTSHGNEPSPRNGVGILLQWLAQPDLFAAYIMPAISKPFSAWYGNDRNQGDRDIMLRMIWDNSPEVFRHMRHAMDELLDSEYP
jgi:hypothetical protein